MTSAEPTRAPDVVVKKRGSETALDMVRSLGLIGVIIAVTLIFVPGLIHPSNKDKYPAVDFSDYVSGFHQVTGKAALAPDLSRLAGWKANAGTLTGPATAEHLHIGFAVPGSKYAGLEESVEPAAAFVRSTLGAGGVAPEGAVMIEGQPWQVRTSNVGEYSLSRTTRGITVVVTGSATVNQLQALAGSLH